MTLVVAAIVSKSMLNGVWMLWSSHFSSQSSKFGGERMKKGIARSTGKRYELH